MKPNFALNLSHDGIGLLHRGKGGWTLVGEVALDDDELGEKLAVLRKTAADLEKGGLATKLIIPASQILYTRIEAPGPDDIAREVQIRAGLEGLTPYAVGELVFDWRKSRGKKVQVAVVARETLDEAEQFAKQHRLNPVSFVASPDDKSFKGEVFFGKAAGAAALLGPGEQVERDDAPVPIPASPAPADEKPADKTGKAGKTGEADKAGKAGEADKTGKAGKAARSGPAAKAEEEEARATPSDRSASEKAGAGRGDAGTGKAGPDTTPGRPAPVDPDEDDARIAALLADVPEPEKPGKGAETASGEGGGAGKSAGKPGDGPAAEPATKGGGNSKPALPLLAPFPPTPDENEEEPVPFLPVPPPPPLPPRRTPPAIIKGRLDKELEHAPQKKAPAKPSDHPKDRTGKRDQDGKGSKSAPVAPMAPEAPEPQPGPAFSSRRAETGTGLGSPVAATGSKTAATNGPERPAFRPESASPAGEAKSGRPGRDSGRIPTPPPPVSGQQTPPVTAPPLPAGKGGGGGGGGTGAMAGNVAAGAGLLGWARSLAGRSKPAAAAANTVVKPAGKAAGGQAKPAAGAAGGAAAEKPAPPPPPGGNAAPPRPPAKAASAGKAETESERMTLFGARASASQVRGKPRYLGLILTLILLLAMAAVALSSVLFFSEDSGAIFNRSSGENEFAAAAIPDVNLSSPIPEEPPPQIGTSAPVPDTPIPEANDQAPDDAAPGLPGEAAAPSLPDMQSGPAGPDLDEQAAQAHYAATGVWQKAPAAPAAPQSGRIDDLYVASIDPAVRSQDAVALPEQNIAAMQEPRPAAPLPPPAAGTAFALDNNGLVTPTPEGTLSPDGILIYSGKPPVVAPPRPGTAAPEQPAPNQLQGIRPKPRPTGLVEDSERSSLGGLLRTELAQIRPRARPASMQALAAAAEAAVAEATAPNELAIASSPAPGYRPRNFASVVERARTNAAASDGSSVVAAAATPTVIPSIPTRASVATHATIDNAIRLNRINLIGVFGSASARRALVRLKNGRYVKVSVGDRLDGGKVISISDTRLIYRKSGKNKALDLLPLG